MHLNNMRDHRTQPLTAKTPSQRSRFSWRWALACFAAAAFLTCAAQTSRQSPSPSPDKPSAPAEYPQHLGDRQTPKPVSNLTRSEREKQITEDNAKLLKLAIDLKAEVDKTSMDTLSLSVVRKADEIEKLARSVKEKMKETIGPAKNSSMPPITAATSNGRK